MTDTGYLYEYFLTHSEKASDEKDTSPQNENGQEEPDKAE